MYQTEQQPKYTAPWNTVSQFPQTIQTIQPIQSAVQQQPQQQYL